MQWSTYERFPSNLMPYEIKERNQYSFDSIVDTASKSKLTIPREHMHRWLVLDRFLNSQRRQTTWAIYETLSQGLLDNSTSTHNISVWKHRLDKFFVLPNERNKIVNESIIKFDRIFTKLMIILMWMAPATCDFCLNTTGAYIYVRLTQGTQHALNFN